MSSDYLLQVNDLKKSYTTDNLILKGISLDIKPGEFVGVLGLSGAGKSTFLRCINRLIEPTSGNILFKKSFITDKDTDNEVMDVCKLNNKELRLLRRKIGMIFQQFNIVKRLTVIDNVLSGSLGYQNAFKSTFRIFSVDDKKKALANLERVGLLSQAYKRADALSGGQQQRVAIARTLMQNPKVILADEPVASLDPKLSREVLGILKKVCKEDGISALVSLHTLELTKIYSDRIIGFQGGYITFDGSADQLNDDEIEKVYTKTGD
ncbi:MAG: phosphonate ABC transporter ATP-binding protein [Candidatus Sericytochromatia bacterium]|nr:phosphonate ABC transporter ATP-binding protein [Candidatus Sericytochromatia bacterium]